MFVDSVGYCTACPENLPDHAHTNKPIPRLAVCVVQSSSFPRGNGGRFCTSSCRDPLLTASAVNVLVILQNLYHNFFTKQVFPDGRVNDGPNVDAQRG